MHSTVVNHAEAINAIDTVGRTNTILLAGQPGVGKSAIAKSVASLNPHHNLSVIDCTLLDLGDFAMPMVKNVNGMDVTTFAPNARFKVQEDKPVIVMLDEIGKAQRAVQNVLLTMVLEQRIGDVYLPQDSIVFATTNLATDRVGDKLEAHALNRLCSITLRNPTADEWISWAMENPNEVAPEVVAWVKQFPHCLASYTEGKSQEENKYIFNPNAPHIKSGSAFVSPRSLVKASTIIRERSKLGHTATMALLAGTVGPSAAADMKVYVEIADKLPTYQTVLADPTTAGIPDDPIARLMMVYGSVSKATKDNLSKLIEYNKRLGTEEMSIFARSLLTNKNLQAIAVTNKDFAEYSKKHHHLFI